MSKLTEKLFSNFNRPKSSVNQNVSRFDLIRDWLRRYCDRESNKDGIILRKELAKTALSRTELLSLYIICKGDPDVILVLDRKTPIVPFTHQEFVDLMSDENHYILTFDYTSKITAKRRELINKK